MFLMDDHNEITDVTNSLVPIGSLALFKTWKEGLSSEQV